MNDVSISLQADSQPMLWIQLHQARVSFLLLLAVTSYLFNFMEIIRESLEV